MQHSNRLHQKFFGSVLALSLLKDLIYNVVKPKEILNFGIFGTF